LPLTFTSPCPPVFPVVNCFSLLTLVLLRGLCVSAVRSPFCVFYSFVLCFLFSVVSVVNCCSLLRGKRLFVVGPHADDLDGLRFVQYLVNKAVLDIDPSGGGASQVAQ